MAKFKNSKIAGKVRTYFASININISHTIHSKSKNESEAPDKTEGSLLLPVQVENNSNN